LLPLSTDCAAHILAQPPRCGAGGEELASTELHPSLIRVPATVCRDEAGPA
jgi:hypothetical protein